MDETKEILQKYIDEGIIEESNMAEGYYGVKPMIMKKGGRKTRRQAKKKNKSRRLKRK